MKKYVVCAVTLIIQSSLCVNSKYERLLVDIETQNLYQLKQDLLDDEYLTRKQSKRLIDDAREIEVGLRNKLSIISSAKDFWGLIFGAQMTLIFSLAFISDVDAFFFKRIDDRKLFSGVRISRAHKKFANFRAILFAFLTYVSGKAAKNGYNLTSGRIPVDHAQEIVQALEKACAAESETNASV